jgi:hypothetical protein
VGTTRMDFTAVDHAMLVGFWVGLNPHSAVSGGGRVKVHSRTNQTRKEGLMKKRREIVDVLTPWAHQVWPVSSGLRPQRKGAVVAPLWQQAGK